MLLGASTTKRNRLYYSKESTLLALGVSCMNITGLGAKIREARKMKGYTIEELAEAAEMGAPYLGEIERGEKTPSMKTFIKIVEALDISSDYILRGELSAGKTYIYNEFTERLDKLNPQQRKIACDILDAFIKNFE